MDLPVNLLDGLGTVAVVVLAGWLVLTGRIVPRSTLDLVRASQEVRLAEVKHDAEEWRAAARISAQQVEAMLTGQQTIIHLLESLDKERP